MCDICICNELEVSVKDASIYYLIYIRIVINKCVPVTQSINKVPKILPPPVT